MPDMLVKLYDLPQCEVLAQSSALQVRRALAPEKRQVCRWIAQHFDEEWASEAEVAFARQPVAIYLAIKESKLVGFACYDATCRGFFGPTGVDKTQRAQGIGESLLLHCLQGMREIGYGYAVIGGAGPVDFYQKKVGAVVIEGSTPGVYRGILAAGTD